MTAAKTEKKMVTVRDGGEDRERERERKIVTDSDSGEDREEDSHGQ